MIDIFVIGNLYFLYIWFFFKNLFFFQTFSKEVDEGFPHIFEELVRLCKIVEQCGLLENNCCNSVEMTSSSEILRITDACKEVPLDNICVPEGIRLPKKIE